MANARVQSVAPQTTVEAPGVEHAGERVPDVWKGIGFPGVRSSFYTFDIVRNLLHESRTRPETKFVIGAAHLGSVIGA
jgi:hypothetical protein